MKELFRQTSSADGAANKQVIPDPRVLAEIRKLQYATRKMAREGIIGKYRSAFRGQGLEFDELREYVPGDDVRLIDWKVTARATSPHIKLFREERELSVMIAVDISGSTGCGSGGKNFMTRGQLLAQVGAILTLIALLNNDKVGLTTFSDRLESYHPAKRARGAVWRIIREVAGFQHAGKTSLPSLVTFLSSVLGRHSIVFILSDFFDEKFLSSESQATLGALAKKHDVTAIQIVDPLDRNLPALPPLEVGDPETGKCQIIEADNRRFAGAYSENSDKWQNQLSDTFKRYGIGHIRIKSDEALLPPLQQYFEERNRKRGRR